MDKETQKQLRLADQIYEGDFVDFTYPSIVLSCCDCGLTHVFVLRVINGQPFLQTFKSDKDTEETRKYMPKKSRRKIIETLGGKLD